MNKPNIHNASNKQKNKPIAIIGLGYVGLPLALEFCKLHNVTGFDISGKRIAELQAGQDSTLKLSPKN